VSKAYHNLSKKASSDLAKLLAANGRRLARANREHLGWMARTMLISGPSKKHRFALSRTELRETIERQGGRQYV